MDNTRSVLSTTPTSLLEQKFLGYQINPSIIYLSGNVCLTTHNTLVYQSRVLSQNPQSLIKVSCTVVLNPDFLLKLSRRFYQRVLHSSLPLPSLSPFGSCRRVLFPSYVFPNLNSLLCFFMFIPLLYFLIWYNSSNPKCDHRFPSQI